MDKEIQESFKDTLEIVFSNKNSLLRVINSNLISVSYDSKEKIFFIVFKKNFIASLLKEKLLDVKNNLENNLKIHIKKLNINGVDQKIELIKFFGKDPSLVETFNIKSKTIEKTLEDKAFKYKHPSQEYSILNSKIIQLDFYNKYLGLVEVVFFKKSYLEYKKEFIIGSVFFWTAIIPIVFLSLGFINFSKNKKATNKMNYLLANNYTPLNKEAKIFVSKFFK